MAIRRTPTLDATGKILEKFLPGRLTSEAILELVNLPGSISSIAASALTGVISLERIHPGGVVVIDKAKAVYGAAGAWPTTRPTARTDVVADWMGDDDPGAVAIAGDRIDLVG